MNNRSIKIAKIKTTTPTRFIETTLDYSKGGISYADYKQYPSGYYLHVQPITEKGDGFVSYTAFTGVKHHVAPGERFSAKTLQQIASDVQKNPIYKQMVVDVCNKQGLILETPLP